MPLIFFEFEETARKGSYNENSLLAPTLNHQDSTVISSPFLLTPCSALYVRVRVSDRERERERERASDGVGVRENG
jgi:hypothetical protein